MFLSRRKFAMFCSAALVLALGATACAGADAPASQQVFTASVQRLAAAWNAGDGNAWAAEFWPDGSLINILGVIFPNQPAVAGVTTAILQGPFKDSTFTPSIRRLRILGSDSAIVDTDISVTHFRTLPPGAVATKPGLLLTRLTLVYQNRAGAWKIEAAQNTAVQP